jgi:methyltransferase (TIGR00027 family)
MSLGEETCSRLSSNTAEAMAALRAAGAAEPDAVLRNPDHLAGQFVSFSTRASTLVKVPLLRRLVRNIAEVAVPGGYYFELARVKHMDAILQSELRNGLSQLVILGAGFDTRAHRFANQLHAVRVYEIDHPTIGMLKRKKVMRLCGRLPAHVTYVDADFTRDDPAERLAHVAYDHGQPTLVILSGVTPYLPEEAVFRLLRFTGTHTSPRTSIVFDYVLKEMVDGDDRYHGASHLRKRLNRLNEPLLFGIPSGTAATVLRRCGLTLSSDVGPRDLAAKYLRRSDGAIAGLPYGFAIIAHARVSREAALQQ